MSDRATGDHSFATIVSSITTLVEHVRASMRLVDGAIARETISGDADASNVIVLDDVTPQYLKARHALNSCGASLDAALKSLLESQTPWLTGGEDRMRCSASRSFRAAK